ncbi:zinc-binding alcohol dehydrogenase [Planoprotostelium fungivorum]|uniref:alcohol dehydrogenase (NADP(+)) n=1 Tax=Planoprotostelium fungivorum TaxID=1890364 RepID=A0A2P6NTA9_9EUKA|nr:zinc-binding alcohol dehydrogenase [Planoprotostelium fungivorum]
MRIQIITSDQRKLMNEKTVATGFTTSNWMTPLFDGPSVSNSDDQSAPKNEPREMTTEYKFQGWMGLDKDSHKGNLVFQEFEPKRFEDGDVDIKITHCGVCASDVHTLSSGWHENVEYPICVGHEIVGTIVRVGPKVEGGLKVGDRVGVGAQSGSCLQCKNCGDHKEPYCTGKCGFIGTYDARHVCGDRSQGGYGDYARVPSRFVVPVPEGLPSDIAAPMMCGGVTVYSPLKKYGAGTTAKKVGVIGIGGLGHFALLFAKALGAEVTAISHSDHKREDAKKLGASHFIITGQEGWDKDNKESLDLVICTTNDAKMPLESFLSLLTPGGVFVLVGIPEEPLPQIKPFSLIQRNVHLCGSLVGSPAEMKEMLELAATQNIKTWIEPYPMDKVNDALHKFHEKGMRYRAVLYNQKHIDNQ